MRNRVLTAAAGAALLAATAGTTANAGPSAAADHSVDQRWRIHQVSSNSQRTVDKGKVRGAPFGKGKIRSVSRPEGSQVRVKFVQKLADGKVKGTVLTSYAPARCGVKFSGAGEFTGGTGKYEGITGEITSWKGRGCTNGKARIRMKGNADY
jgi:hypothetical protein